MPSEKFCLKWNAFEENISSSFRAIREEKEFFDVTLACEDDQISAHKVILSACSPFFRAVLKRNPHQHPLLYLKGVSFEDVTSVLSFMYHGEVSVAQDQLTTFLQVAEDLQVKGLTKSSEDIERETLESQPLAKTKSKRKSFHSSEAPSSFSKRQRIQEAHSQDYEVQEVKQSAPVKAEQVTGEPTHGLILRLAQPDNENYSAELVSYEEEGYEEDYENNDYTNEAFQGSNDQTSGLYVNCPVCAKPMYKKNIARHIAVKHTDQTPSQCNLCLKTMKNGWSLKEHERKFHGIFKANKDISIS